MLLRSSEEILASFDAVRADFLGGIFSSGIKAQKWASIDLSKAVQRLGTTRSRIIRAFTFLEERGDLALKVAGLRQGYRIKARPEDPQLLKSELIKRFESRERQDVNRVREVVQLVEHPGCIVRYLLHHFGEDLGRDCGHCDHCSGNSGKVVRVTRERQSPVLDRAKITGLRRQYGAALGSGRQIARFLCGLSSPFLTQTKLNKHPDFGSLSEFPFQAGLEVAHRLVGSTAGAGKEVTP